MKANQNTPQPSTSMAVSLLFVFVLSMTRFNATGAEVQLLSQPGTVKLFGGGPRPVELRWSNTVTTTAALPIFVRLSQATSDTVAPWSYDLWKRITILPGQTILESAVLKFPDVRAQTLFLAQWATQDGQILGTSKITVFPTNLLGELTVLSGHKPIALFDPSNFFQGIFKRFEIYDLRDRPPGEFDGKLAIVYQVPHGSPSPQAPVTSLINLASRGVGIVWIREAPERSDRLLPSFVAVRKGAGNLVVAQPGLFANLPEDPQAQINRVELARMALCPDRFPGNSLDVEP
jgi:hypothetical protein